MKRPDRQLQNAIIAAATRGLTIAETAAELSVAYSTVQSAAWRMRRAGLMPVRFRKDLSQPPSQEQDQQHKQDDGRGRGSAPSPARDLAVTDGDEHHRADDDDRDGRLGHLPDPVDPTTPESR